MAFFSNSYRVSISNVGKSEFITNKGILSLLEDIACMHSDEAGFGIKTMPITNLSWVLLHWKVKIIKRVKYGEIVNLKTWSRYSTKVCSYRDFEIYDNNNELVCIATSKWALVNTQKNGIEKITEDIISHYNPENKSVFGELEIAKIKEPSLGSVDYQFHVLRRDIDVNNHMHNLYYLDYAYQVLPDDVYLLNELNNLEIMYKSSAKLGNAINCYYCNDNGIHYITMKSNNNKTLHAIIKLF